METRAPLSMQSDLVASELGGRPREVFRHLVEAYLTSGEPVGSRTLSQRLPLTLSPALDPQCDGRSGADGAALRPHTSAGRVPTEKGLRLFVDGMLQIGDLTSEERIQIEERIAASGRPFEGRAGPRPRPCCRGCHAARAFCWPPSRKCR